MEQPKYFDFAFLVPRRMDRFQDEIARPDWVTFRMAVDQVVACVEQGAFREDDPLETAITVWAQVHGLVILFRTGRLGMDADSFRATYLRAVDRMLQGLKAGS